MPRKIRELMDDLARLDLRVAAEKEAFKLRPSEGGETGHPVRQGWRRRKEISRTGRCESNRGIKIMSVAARYVKLVEWSDEDNCFVGSCPGLFYGGCHGDDEKSVFAELCQIVEETVRLYEAENKPLPPVTSGYDWANTIVNATTTS